MQQFWIPARKALSVVARELGGEYPAILAICERAHAGLLETRAELLIVDEKRAEDAALPASFWWAEGHEALDQDWVRGDFATCVDRDVRMRAFDVQFEFEGIRKLIPAEAAAQALQRLSVSADPNWLSAKDARRFAYDKLGANPAAAGSYLIEQCRLGFVAAKAPLMQTSRAGRPENWDTAVREWDVPSWFWQNFTQDGSSSQDWERGVFNGKARFPSGPCWIRLSGVHFSKDTLEALLPHQQSSPTANLPNKGGRPRKDWWDDLWCAMWGQVHRGELIPKNQADVEKAMLAWISEQDESVSESTIRPLARKMFTEMEREGEN